MSAIHKIDCNTTNRSFRKEIAPLKGTLNLKIRKITEGLKKKTEALLCLLRSQNKEETNKKSKPKVKCEEIKLLTTVKENIGEVRKTVQNKLQTSIIKYKIAQVNGSTQLKSVKLKRNVNMVKGGESKTLKKDYLSNFNNFANVIANKKLKIICSQSTNATKHNSLFNSQGNKTLSTQSNKHFAG